MGGFFSHLCHPNGIDSRVEIAQARRVLVQLVTQNQHQASKRRSGWLQRHGTHAASVEEVLRWRQAFEQYWTCSQFLAQALRQVISRAHTLHGLLGKWLLLPLKVVCFCTCKELAGCYCSKKRCASKAAMQPEPALVIAWRYTWSCTSPAANTPGTLVCVAMPCKPLCVTM